MCSRHNITLWFGSRIATGLAINTRPRQNLLPRRYSYARHLVPLLISTDWHFFFRNTRLTKKWSKRHIEYSSNSPDRRQLYLTSPPDYTTYKLAYFSLRTFFFLLYCVFFFMIFIFIHKIRNSSVVFGRLSGISLRSISPVVLAELWEPRRQYSLRDLAARLPCLQTRASGATL